MLRERERERDREREREREREGERGGEGEREGERKREGGREGGREGEREREREGERDILHSNIPHTHTHTSTHSHTHTHSHTTHYTPPPPPPPPQTHSRQIHAAQWFIIMNYFVHAVMYTYYAVRASGHYRPPVWVNMFITLLQLTQMIVGVYINIYVCYTMTADSDWYCDGKIETTYLYVYWSFAMYFSYFVLFALFFYETYFKKSSISSSKDGRSKPSNGLLRNGVVNDGGNKFQKCTLDNGNEISTTRDGLHKRKTKAGHHMSEVGSHVVNEHVDSGMRESSTGNNFTDNGACG